MTKRVSHLPFINYGSDSVIFHSNKNKQSDDDENTKLNKNNETVDSIV